MMKFTFAIASTIFVITGSVYLALQRYDAAAAFIAGAIYWYLLANDKVRKAKDD